MHSAGWYDAECPEGSRSFFDLPCLARQITTALT